MINAVILPPLLAEEAILYGKAPEADIPKAFSMNTIEHKNDITDDATARKIGDE